MLKSTLTILITLAAGISAQAYAACNPGPNEVALFQHSNYRGICSVLPVGDYPDSRAMLMPNDSVSSIKIGKNVEIQVHNHSSRGNTSKFDKFISGGGSKSSGFVYQNFSKSQASLSGTRIGNDRISAVYVFYPKAEYDFKRGDCYPGDNSISIAIYQHSGFGGNCRLLDLGTYRNSKEMRFKNDSASSVEIGKNSKVYVELYSDSNFRGRKDTLRNSKAFLATGAVGDNKLTSIKVLRK